MRYAISKMVTGGRAFVETAMSMHHSDFEVSVATFGAACLVGIRHHGLTPVKLIAIVLDLLSAAK